MHFYLVSHCFWHFTDSQRVNKIEEGGVNLKIITSLNQNLQESYYSFDANKLP